MRKDGTKMTNDEGRMTANSRLQNYLILLLRLDLVVIIVYTLMMIAVALLPTLRETARPVIGLIFMFFVPGYVLLAALFPSKRDISLFERGVLSFGVSVVISTLVGASLNYSQWGVSSMPAIFSLTLVISVALIVAYLRRQTLPTDLQFQLI